MLEGNRYYVITNKPIQIQRALDFITSPEHGAITTFIGSIRNTNQEKHVIGVSYDIFESLALLYFDNICQKAQQQWGETLKIYIAQYKGRLTIKGISLIIAVSSPHRDESFKACRFILEKIKHEVPIWKQEHYVNGDSNWVKGHALCAQS